MAEAARAEVAAYVSVLPDEVTFTSGGSESDNWALAGIVAARGGGHVVTSAVEHPAALATARALERAGRIRLPAIGVDRSGRVDPKKVARALAPDTSSSRSCWRTTTAGRYSRWPRSPKRACGAACSCTPPRRKPSAGSRWTPPHWSWTRSQSPGTRNAPRRG